MTVKASELRPEDLRIGCLVEQGVISSICYVQGRIGCWITESIYDSSPGTFYGIEAIMPILFTEKWTEMFALVQRSDMKECYLIPCVDHRLFAVYNIKGRFSLILETDKDKGTWANLMTIEYVHQFQNAIKALTGEELKVK